ncbi:LOW QUALITY PROTEIN: hypothetical protein QYF61_005743 [Mycteria americana]|uniref:Uncharacterized protein n=1 Tax=Mycteria americana TaxID=33587 RepID=A0AAN7NRF7_MYCAM|nr:LOW QUALITY PROTEIN: hypothetical protein QYF61_005743 [Mycteria americana]
MSLSTSSKCLLNTSRDGDSTTSLGSLFQCLTTLLVKTFFLTSNLNLPWRNLRPFPLVLSLVNWEKRLTPTSLQPPFRYEGPKTEHSIQGAASPGHDRFPTPAGHPIPDTSQDAIGLLGHLGTLLVHIQRAINQYPQDLFHQAAFQPLFPKPCCMGLLPVVLHGVVVIQVQDLALGLVKPHTIDLGPSIQPVQVPLQSLATLKQINTPTQLGVICKLTEGALNPFVQIIDKDIKQDWPQHRALGNTACDRPPTGVNSIHHHSLGLAIQPVLYPAKKSALPALGYWLIICISEWLKAPTKSFGWNCSARTELAQVQGDHLSVMKATISESNTLKLIFAKGFLKVLYFALSHLPETTVIATVRELTSRCNGYKIV